MGRYGHFAGTRYGMEWSTLLPWNLASSAYDTASSAADWANQEASQAELALLKSAGTNAARGIVTTSQLVHSDGFQTGLEKLKNAAGDALDTTSAWLAQKKHEAWCRLNPFACFFEEHPWVKPLLIMGGILAVAAWVTALRRSGRVAKRFVSEHPEVLSLAGPEGAAVGAALSSRRRNRRRSRRNRR